MSITEPKQLMLQEKVRNMVIDGFTALPGFSSIRGALNSVDFPRNKMVIVKAFDMFYPVIIKSFQNEAVIGISMAYIRESGLSAVLPYNKDINVPFSPVEFKGRTNGQKHWNDSMLKLLRKKTHVDFYIFSSGASTEPKIIHSKDTLNDTYANFGVLLSIYFSPKTLFYQYQLKGLWDFFSPNVTWGLYKLMRDTKAEKINPFYGFILKDGKQVFYKSDFFWDLVSFWI